MNKVDQLAEQIYNLCAGSGCVHTALEAIEMAFASVLANVETDCPGTLAAFNTALDSFHAAIGVKDQSDLN